MPAEPSSAASIISFRDVSYAYKETVAQATAREKSGLSVAQATASTADAQTTATPQPQTKGPALEHISLDIQPGQLVAIIGANGSGKSTLAKHVNALLTPTTGKVLVLETDTSDPSKTMFIRSHAGVVFQNPASQMVTSNVADEVAFGPENLGLPREKITERVHDALDTVHMLDFWENDPGHLSGGQQQRVAIAAVLAMRPDVIVLDEPNALLDPRARRGIRRVIHELSDAGITVLLITHSMNEAVHTDRVIVMDEGRIILDGTPEEVFGEKELLRQVGLQVPYSVILAEALAERGIHVPETIHTEELKEELCRLRSTM